MPHCSPFLNLSGRHPILIRATGRSTWAPSLIGSVQRRWQWPARQMMLVTPRQYVDLQRADLAGMLDLLISKALINSADKTAILTTPTTDYERHIKGLEQPI